MWITKFDEISQHIPKDNKWHDIQIINNFIWVDGVLKNTPAEHFDNFYMFDQALTQKEITDLAANKPLKPTPGSAA